jgi:hypothetical protein
MSNEKEDKNYEYTQRKLKEKLELYNIKEKLEKVPTSNSYTKVIYNDGKKDVVDPLSEFFLCKKSFEYFVNNYSYYLDAKNKKVSAFKLFPFQKDLIVPNFLKEQFVIFRKSRQVGASVLSGQYALWLANFNIAQDVLIVSKTRVDAQDFKSKAMVTYERLPNFLKTKPTRDGQNMTTLKLMNKSRIITRAQAPDAGRGGSWALVILDEAAFMPYADEIWSSVYPALSNTEGQCFVISTSNGVGNFYHRTWIGAENGENDFYPIYIPWWKFPGRDNPWLPKLEEGDTNWIESQLEKEYIDSVKGKVETRVNKINNSQVREDVYLDELVKKFIEVEQERQLSFEGNKEDKPWLKRQKDNADSQRKFSQEILAEFLGSGNTVVSSKILKALEEKEEDPIRKDFLYEDDDAIKGLWIFEEPKESINYTITIDVASGAGNDHSTMQVFRDDNLKQVAEYKRQLDTKTFAYYIKKVARFYNTAFVVIETNQGQSVFNDVFLHETDPYMNTYYELKKKTYRGLHTGPVNKKLMIDEFLYSMENNVIKIVGKRTIDELKVYIWHNGKPEASRGYNDDLVLPIMFLAYLIKYGGRNIKPLGFATSDQILGDSEGIEDIKTEFEYIREESMVKERIENDFGVDFETYQWLTQD